MMPKHKTTTFITVQVTLFCVAVAIGSYRSQQLSSSRRLPSLREKPLSVEPRYDYDFVISDEQLERVLLKLQPRFPIESPKLNYVDHALRFWTPAAEFEDKTVMSGVTMRQLLTNHLRFVEAYGPDEAPLLIDKPLGVGVRVQEGNATSSHVDHTVACLAEVGTPLDFPIITAHRQTTFRALVEQSLRDFSVNQIEYEWSAMIFAMYLPPTTQWYTSEGQRISFDRLAKRIMRESLPNGVCFANHRLFTLAVFLQVDEITPILSADARSEVLDYLLETTGLLVRHQHSTGFWNDQWPHQVAESRNPTTREGDRLAERILATGHALEWWAIAPKEVHPPRHVLVDAGQWMVRTIDEMSDDEVDRAYTYLSHAGRALALWRSREPADVIRQVETKSHTAATNESVDAAAPDGAALQSKQNSELTPGNAPGNKPQAP